MVVERIWSTENARGVLSPEAQEEMTDLPRVHLFRAQTETGRNTQQRKVSGEAEPRHRHTSMDDGFIGFAGSGRLCSEHITV